MTYSPDYPGDGCHCFGLDTVWLSPVTCASQDARVYVNVPSSEPTTSSSTSASASTTRATEAPAPTETSVVGSTCTSESTYCPDALPFDSSFQPYGCTLSFSLLFSRR